MFPALTPLQVRDRVVCCDVRLWRDGGSETGNRFTSKLRQYVGGNSGPHLRKAFRAVKD